MARNPFAVASRRQATAWNASFEGASTSRLFYDWGAAALHPDRELNWALRELRARARDLVRNNDYAAGVLEAFADNVIGWQGIRCKPLVVDPSGRPVREINWTIERGWGSWGEPATASADEQESWLERQRLIMRTWVQDGEVFLRHREGWSNRFGYTTELVDADLLDETFSVPPDQNGIEIRMGVEVDRYGRRLAYHFFKYHPSEGRGRERVRVPAREIEHYFARYRPGQTRGYSLFAPVLTTWKMVHGLTEAELVASRMAASSMGFIQNMSPEAIAAHAERLRILAQQGKKQEPQKLEMAPGRIPELLPGQEFQGFDPTHPNTAFEPFLKVMLRGVARAFGISYLTLTGDVAEANYSSMRAGLIPERDHWKVIQTITAARIHTPVYRRWLGTSLLAGALDLPTPVPSDYHAVEWRGRGWKWVDPLDDLNAALLEVKLGVNSRQRIAAEMGRDYEAIVDEIREEEDYAEGEGVDVSVRDAQAAPPRGPEDPQRPRGRTALANRVQHALRNGRHHG